MHFPNGAMGNLVSSWMTGPKQERLVFQGTEGSLECSTDLLRIYDPSGTLMEEEKQELDEDELIGRQVRQFAESVLDAEVTAVSTAREHLANVAIIESAYLSARTQLPESLKVYGSLFEI
jgi:predicted dehydrogenase